MPRPTTQERLDKIHAEALVEFDAIQTAQRDERLQCLQDRRFYSIAGAQWEGSLASQFENKPKFEVNKIHLSVIRIINEYRNNRITVDFTSKNGDENDRLADTCDGLFRADELDSSAEEAYDNAFEEAVGGGIGAWRLRAEYEDEEDDENEYQRIRIEPIYDADSTVFFDLGARRQDKRDAKRCFVLIPHTPEEYEETWGDDPASWPKDIQQLEFDWATPDTIWVAEYYRVEQVSDTIQIWETLDGEERRYRDSDFENDEDLMQTLTATGATKVREKKVKRQRVHKYIMSGGGILEDCKYIAGKYIPIIMTYGKRWYVDNVERAMGHVRLSKDAQRLKNMQLSKLGEIAALSAVEKPILTPEQVAGHEVLWAEDNLKNNPYMLINLITDANGNELPPAPIAYTKPPQIPPAMAALLQITEKDMQDLLGNQQAGEEIQPNISGKAIELVQNRLDMQSFIYLSNFAKAIKRTGEVWLSMAKDILVERGRKMKAIGKQDEMRQVELGRPITGENGEVEYENDLSKANFDVAVDVGPSSSSKRAATVRALTSMMQFTADPETLQVLSAMVMMNMEGEGVDEVRDYFRQRLIKMGVVQPTEQEARDLMEAAANEPPDANEEYLKAAARAEDARGAEAASKTALNEAKADESRAKTIEMYAGIDRDDLQAAIQLSEAVEKEAVTTQPQQPGERVGV